MTSINVGKGLFRLWVVLTVCWIMPLTWVKWNDLDWNNRYDLPPLPCPDLPSPLQGCELWQLEHKGKSRSEHRFDAAQMIILPPTLLLLLGLAGVWVLRGFNRNSNQQG